MTTAEITHHPAGPVDGSGRERHELWRATREAPPRPVSLAREGRNDLPL